MGDLRSLLRTAGLGLCCLAAAVGLAGCGGSLNSFTWRAEHVPGNLDPQLAAESPEIIAVTHLFSGLYRLDAEGVPQPACAERSEVSADGRVWTFHLKPGLRYAKRRGEDAGYDVTAEDFVFGLQRVFLPETGSPYAEALGNIAGSAALLAGGDPALLEVRAADALTLVITLTEPDPAFLEKLCLPGAMPCDEEFFESTGGAYGLGMATTIGNGSFYLYNWTESGLFLRRTPAGTRIDSLRIVLAEDTAAAPAASPAASGETPAASSLPGPAQLVQEGKCDAALYDGPLGTTGLTELPYTTTTWGLLFRCDEGPLANRTLRQALAAIAYDTALTLPEGSAAAQSLTPPDMDYGGPSPLPRFAQQPVELYREALAQLELNQISGLTVLVPEGAAQLFGQINQEWQRELSLFCNVQELPLGELQQRLADGDYQIALAPCTPPDGEPLHFLAQFGPESPVAFSSGAVQQALAEAASFPADSAGRSAALAAAEAALLEECPVVPLFTQTKALLLSPGIEGVVFSPFAPSLDLTWATRA